LETEIEPGTFGVKSEDLCSRLGIEMSNPNLNQLVEQSQNLVSKIATHPDYKQLLNEGYQPDLNIADAQTALTYLSWELERNREPAANCHKVGKTRMAQSYKTLCQTLPNSEMGFKTVF
jgi:hypothetical protein